MAVYIWRRICRWGWGLVGLCGWFIFSTNSCCRQRSALTDRQRERQISKKRKKTVWIQELGERTKKESRKRAVK